MSPSITEILFALGAGNRVVAVTDFCTYPKTAALLPKVGGMLNPSIEALISMKPDMLIHHQDSHKIEETAARLGIRSLGVSFENLNDIYRSIKTIGAALGTPEAAEGLLEKLRKGIAFHRSKLENLKPKSVLLILGDSETPMRDLYAVGKGTFLDELLTLAGGQNILSDSAARYPKISREFVIARSPEAIIIAGPKANLSREKRSLWKGGWQRYTTVQAVKNDQIYFIGADYILIPGPRLLNIVENFARAIHPEIFPPPEPVNGRN
ncbi:MAG: ABC transporter substrate-binding protein [Nitrospinales bacterium]